MDSTHDKVDNINMKKEMQEPESLKDSPNITSDGTKSPHLQENVKIPDESGGIPMRTDNAKLEAGNILPQVPSDNAMPVDTIKLSATDQNLMLETTQNEEVMTEVFAKASGDHSTLNKSDDDDTKNIAKDDEYIDVTSIGVSNEETKVADDENIDINSSCGHVKKLPDGVVAGDEGGNSITDDKHDDKTSNDFEINNMTVSEKATSQNASNMIKCDDDIKVDCDDEYEMELKWDTDDGNDNIIPNDDETENMMVECDDFKTDDVEKVVDESYMDGGLGNKVSNDDKDTIDEAEVIADGNSNIENTKKEIKAVIEKKDDISDENTDLEVETDGKIEDVVKAIDKNSEAVIKTSENDLKSDIADDGNNIVKLTSEQKDENETIDSNSQDNDTTMDKIPIKKDHGLHRPDVMLEIPTQELIDIDDIDISIGLDQSISPNDHVNSTTVDEQEVQGDEAIVEGDEGKVMNNDELEDAVVRVSAQIEADLESNIEDLDRTVETTNEAVIENKLTDIQPTTSTNIPNKMTSDTSDEVTEVSDSLCLLAESSRVMEDDDDPEEDEDVDGDGDDDEDFDQDESSNQMTTAEHSEDSNAQPSESDANKEEWEGVRGSQVEIESPTVENQEQEFQFKICNIETEMTCDDLKTTEQQKTTELTTNEDNTIKDSESAEKSSDTIIEKAQETQQSDIETVRLSDTSDNEADIEPTTPPEEAVSKTEEVVNKEVEAPPPDAKLSPNKTKKLVVSQVQQPVFNVVDLEESSSEDDIQEVNKPVDTTPIEATKPEEETVTSVNLPTDIEVMCTSAGNTSDIVTKQGEVVIIGVPKPPPVKLARLNTSEVSIKTASTPAETTLVITEAKSSSTEKSAKENRSKPVMSLEIFSLDSDEEEPSPPAKEQAKPSSPSPPQEAEKPLEAAKCVNQSCQSDASVPHIMADAATIAYYDVARKRRASVCLNCAQVVIDRKQKLVAGIKDLGPLLALGENKPNQELVEISDSESEDEPDETEPTSDVIGPTGAKLLEENLADLINETWRKYKMDTRLKDTHDQLDAEIQKLESESKEIDDMLNECQVATDKLRNDLYATFEQEYKQLPPVVLHDTPFHFTTAPGEARCRNALHRDDAEPFQPTRDHNRCNPVETSENNKYFGPENDSTATPSPAQSRQLKRRSSSSMESQAKRPAIPLGYAPLDADTAQKTVQETKAVQPTVENKNDDDKEVSVVKLSAESAPADLPPPGDISRPPLKVGMTVFAMRNAFGPWLRGKILETQAKSAEAASQFTMCRVKFDHKIKNPCKILPARSLAYPDPAEVRLTIGTRVVALFNDQTNVKRYFSGVVAEIPNPVNNYRYLVFFDDGYAQYVQHRNTRLVCESSPLVWEEVHPFSREFVREYLLAYPERPMVRLHEGQSLKTEWNGKWWASRVVKVDASLAQVFFQEDGRREWIYRGSTRLAPLYLELKAAERHRQRPMPRSKALTRTNMPYVEYTRSEEQDGNKQQATQAQQQQNEEIRRQRAVAKKSTAIPPPPAPNATQQSNLDTVTSRVVYYTPKNAVRPYKMVSHVCGSKCKRSDVLTLKELRTYNPLAKPLLSGWERQIVRFKGHKEVMYRAPCGRRLRNMWELHRYLRSTQSELPVDLFDFHHSTHCLAEFVLNKCLVGKKDLSHGKENVPVPCVNYYDESLPEFCSYNTERTPTAGVPLNLDPEFLCGCDCTDDCEDKSKCACWKMTLEGARTIGLEGPNVGYVYKRLPEPLPSGIYECNSRCKCKATCLNRVAQHPLQLKLQVFKTLNRGWGIRALNDVPKGSFLCVYAGNLLTDATANLDGLNEGDEYLAELDYIEVVEQMKEGYEEDIPAGDKKLDKKELGKQSDEDSEEELPSSGEEGGGTKSDKEDDDFRPGYREISTGVSEFKKELRKRNKAKKKEEDDAKSKEKQSGKDDDDCITISDDEEVREPSRFTAQAGMGANEFISKYRSVRSHFGKDEACYIMDAKVQGNIGRYLNHSCLPNVFVQNVFVDTHDPRFPWVAFFALSHVKAGTELTWNYNYDVGSVPGKVLYCYCGTPNCRGRLL